MVCVRQGHALVFASSFVFVLACGGGADDAQSSVVSLDTFDTLDSLESLTSLDETASTTMSAETGSDSGTGDGDGDGDPGDGDGDPGDGDPTDSGPKFDIIEPDLPGMGCMGNGQNGELDFSYIWIANSPQGTVSKIDTQSLVELARYQVRPQGGGDPSRTSVNLSGDMVVGSRFGGVTKIYARQADCVDDNGTPGLQTSNGKNNVLAWGEEECVAWYTDYSFLSERAVAWTSGEFNQGTCKWEDAEVWVGATNDAVNLEILRLNGDTGVEQDSVQIPGTAGFMSRSPYGAAVDPDNNLWAVNGYCGGTLVFVDHDDLSYDLITPPNEVCAYGITVDSQGFVWVGGYQTYSGRYDPQTQTWDLVQAQGLGIQEDAEGRLWLGAYGQNGVYAIDGDTLQVLSYTAVPTTGQSKGVAVDFFGYIWVVSDAGTTAVRLDPDTLDIQTYAGLDSPYSYSDMTGWGLKNTTGDPQG
jgi:hypothetical protein